jgi:hypothetical protein
MFIDDLDRVYEELDIGEEQVSSNECWVVDDANEPEAPVYEDLALGEEQVTSNECYDTGEEQ